jgi:hypothetical protein
MQALLVGDRHLGEMDALFPFAGDVARLRHGG